jgi:hypothetical protein
MATSLDDLAKGHASDTPSRDKAIRLVGGALVGAALASVVPGTAFADDETAGVSVADAVGTPGAALRTA